MTWQEQMKSASQIFWREKNTAAMETAYLAAIKEAEESGGDLSSLVEKLTDLGLDVSMEADHGGKHEYFPDALKLWDRTLTIATKIYGRADERCIKLNEYLALSLYRLGKHTEAEESLRQTIRVARAAYGDDHKVVLHMQKCLARLLYWINRPDEAIGVMNDVLKQEQSIYGPEHSAVAATRMELKDFTSGRLCSPENVDKVVAEKGIGRQIKAVGEEFFTPDLKVEDFGQVLGDYLGATKSIIDAALASTDKQKLVEVIVRLASYEPNWQQRFAEAMKLRGITVEEIEKEIKRQALGGV